MKTKQLEVSPGNNISAACDEAVKMAKLEHCNVEFDFNDQKITATPDSDAAALAKGYMDECERRHAEYIASPEYKRQQEECERRQRERESKLNAMLADAPEHMSLRDPEGWKKSCEVNSGGWRIWRSSDDLLRTMGATDGRPDEQGRENRRHRGRMLAPRRQ